MTRPIPDFGPDGPAPFAHSRPWRELVTELHAPADRAFRHLRDRMNVERAVLWFHEPEAAALKAAAVWEEGETWDGEEEIPLEDFPRLRRMGESARRAPFAMGGSLWAPLVLFGKASGFLEVRLMGPAHAPVPRLLTVLEETARALALSVWRVALGVQDTRRELHLRTLSEVSVLVHQSLKPERLLEDAARRLVKNLGLDRVKIFLWEPRRRHFRGEISATLLKGVREIDREIFNPDQWKGEDATRLRHAVPLSAAGEIVGWMAVDNLLSLQEIAMDEIHLLEAVSGQLALAVRNASLYEGVETLATTDELTRLLLGRVFNDRLAEECRRAERTQTTFAVCMLDVDTFKSINDTHGHPVGDRVLAGVARRLKTVSRRMDVVARYAGDEFIALLPHANAEQAMSFAQRVVESVRKLAVKGARGALVRPTVSLGVSVFPTHGTKPDELVRAADEALYQAKRAGRDGAALKEVPGGKDLLLTTADA